MLPQAIALAAERRIKEQLGDLIFANALLSAEVEALRVQVAAHEAQNAVTVNGGA